jgi:hypothetical protein
MVNSYSEAGQFKRFVDVVNSQDKYNYDGSINAIPIIIYHRIGESDATGYNTEVKLFNKEMKYLDDNGFTVLTMADLAYDDKFHYTYLKHFNEQALTGKIAGLGENTTLPIVKFSGN